MANALGKWFFKLLDAVNQARGRASERRALAELERKKRALENDPAYRAYKVMHHLLHPPAPPEDVVVDWHQAPDGFHIWKFDARKNRAVWLNGKSTIEEYGQVWEAMPAPDFGATTTCKLEMTVDQQLERRARHKLAHLEQRLPGGPSEEPGAIAPLGRRPRL